jgi:hypothetical protein
MSVSHVNALYPAILDNDLCNAGIGEYLTPRFLNLRDDGVGDLPATTYRVKTAIEIMPGDHCVHHED